MKKVKSAIKANNLIQRKLRQEYANNKANARGPSVTAMKAESRTLMKTMKATNEI